MYFLKYQGFVVALCCPSFLPSLQHDMKSTSEVSPQVLQANCNQGLKPGQTFHTQWGTEPAIHYVSATAHCVSF